MGDLFSIQEFIKYYDQKSICKYGTLQECILTVENLL